MSQGLFVEPFCLFCLIKSAKSLFWIATTACTASNVKTRLCSNEELNLILTQTKEIRGGAKLRTVTTLMVSRMKWPNFNNRITKFKSNQSQTQLKNCKEFHKTSTSKIRNHYKVVTHNLLQANKSQRKLYKIARRFAKYTFNKKFPTEEQIKVLASMKKLNNQQIRYFVQSINLDKKPIYYAPQKYKSIKSCMRVKFQCIIERRTTPTCRAYLLFANSLQGLSLIEYNNQHTHWIPTSIEKIRQLSKQFEKMKKSQSQLRFIEQNILDKYKFPKSQQQKQKQMITYDTRYTRGIKSSIHKFQQQLERQQIKQHYNSDK